MRQIYFEFLYQSGALLACILCVVFTLAFTFNIIRKAQVRRISVYLLIFVTIISAEFYPIQLVIFSLNIVYPITLILLLMQWKKVVNSRWLAYSMFTVHSLMLIIGLVALSEQSNTWGDGPAPIGAFIIPNSLVIIFYLSTKIDNIKLISLSKIIIGISVFIFIFLVLNGFEGLLYGEILQDKSYFSDNVMERKRNALICMILLVFEGLILRNKKFLLRMENGNKIKELEE